MRILRSKRADEDLIEIWNSIAQDNVRAADRMIDRIVERWRQLESHPHSGPSRDDIGPGIRHLVSGSYLTLYRLDHDGIRVLRVLYGRRRISSSLIEE